MRLSIIAYAAHFSSGLRAFILAVIVAGIFPVMALADQYCVTDGSITPSTPDTIYQIYQDNGDFTVTDLSTGLMWMQCSLGQYGKGCNALYSVNFSYNWKDALAMAVEKNKQEYAGYSDWRLPNVKELNSLVEISCYGPSINETFFPHTPPVFYWSSSAYIYDKYARGVDFLNGDLTAKKIDYKWGSVRLVRGGK